MEVRPCVRRSNASWISSSVSVSMLAVASSKTNADKRVYVYGYQAGYVTGRNQLAPGGKSGMSSKLESKLIAAELQESITGNSFHGSSDMPAFLAGFAAGYHDATKTKATELNL